MLCRNRLHEHDGTWRGPNGERCIECYRARRRVQDRRRRTTGEYRAKRRVANLTPEQHERKNARQRIANMTPEQIERKRALDRKNTRENTLTGKHAAEAALFRERHPDKIREQKRLWGRSPRARAGQIARTKYGLSLHQIERDGLLDAYPEIQTVLTGGTP